MLDCNVSFLFKLTVSSLRKRDHFLAYLYSLLPTMTHDTNVQFREYGQQKVTPFVFVPCPTCGSLTSFYLSCYEWGKRSEPDIMDEIFFPDKSGGPYF